MIKDFSKPHGYINTKANIISLIPPVTHIFFVMQLVIIRTGHSLTRELLLNPVEGWTNHHSIIESNGKWYLFYHDVQLSGKTHLRNVKVTELKYNDDGTYSDYYGTEIDLIPTCTDGEGHQHTDPDK